MNDFEIGSRNENRGTRVSLWRTNEIMMHSLLAGLMALLLTGCTILSPQGEAHYRSRVYNLSQPVVFDAVKAQMIDYTMALATVDPAKGVLKSQPDRKSTRLNSS